METILVNSGRVRRVTEKGREYLVAPLTLPHCSGVYLIKNETNGKVYVGSAASVWKRCYAHKLELNKGTHCNRHLQKSWNKYGEQSFTFTLIERCKPEDRVVREQYWIDHYQSFKSDVGYNICPKAGSSLGVKRSEETKRKLSDLQRNWKPSKEMLEAARKVNTGRPCPKSPEHRAKISASHKGKKLSKEHIEAIRKGNLGRKPTEETRKKLRDSHRNRSAQYFEDLRERMRNRSPEVRKRMSEGTARSNRERVWTEDMRRKASDAQKGKVLSEYARKRVSETHKGKVLSEETKAKISEAKKLYWAKRRGEL